MRKDLGEPERKEIFKSLQDMTLGDLYGLASFALQAATERDFNAKDGKPIEGEETIGCSCVGCIARYHAAQAFISVYDATTAVKKK